MCAFRSGERASYFFVLLLCTIFEPATIKLAFSTYRIAIYWEFRRIKRASAKLQMNLRFKMCVGFAGRFEIVQLGDRLMSPLVAALNGSDESMTSGL